MYSPKIKEDLVIELYQQAKLESIPMTKLVDQILRDALNRRVGKKMRRAK